MRCSGRKRPTRRAKRAEALAIRSGLVRRMNRSSHTARRPAAASTSDFARLASRMRSALVESELTPTVLERHDDLAEHLAAFQALEAAREILQRNFGVDHRQKALAHLGECVADVAHR